MKLKVINKWISIMCAVTIASSCMMTSVGAGSDNNSESKSFVMESSINSKEGEISKKLEKIKNSLAKLQDDEWNEFVREIAIFDDLRSLGDCDDSEDKRLKILVDFVESVKGIKDSEDAPAIAKKLTDKDILTLVEYIIYFAEDKNWDDEEVKKEIDKILDSLRNGTFDLDDIKAKLKELKDKRLKKFSNFKDNKRSTRAPGYGKGNRSSRRGRKPGTRPVIKTSRNKNNNKNKNNNINNKLGLEGINGSIDSSTNDSDNELEKDIFDKGATRIQSWVRGHLARKKFNQAKQNQRLLNEILLGRVERRIEFEKRRSDEISLRAYLSKWRSVVNKEKDNEYIKELEKAKEELKEALKYQLKQERAATKIRKFFRWASAKKKLNLAKAKEAVGNKWGKENVVSMSDNFSFWKEGNVPHYQAVKRINNDRKDRKAAPLDPEKRVVLDHWQKAMKIDLTGPKVEIEPIINNNIDNNNSNYMNNSNINNNRGSRRLTYSINYMGKKRPAGDMSLKDELGLHFDYSKNNIDINNYIKSKNNYINNMDNENEENNYINDIDMNNNEQNQNLQDSNMNNINKFDGEDNNIDINDNKNNNYSYDSKDEENNNINYEENNNNQFNDINDMNNNEEDNDNNNMNLYNQNINSYMDKKSYQNIDPRQLFNVKYNNLGQVSIGNKENDNIDINKNKFNEEDNDIDINDIKDINNYYMNNIKNNNKNINYEKKYSNYINDIDEFKSYINNNNNEQNQNLQDSNMNFKNINDEDINDYYLNYMENNNYSFKNSNYINKLKNINDEDISVKNNYSKNYIKNNKFNKNNNYINKNKFNEFKNNNEFSFRNNINNNKEQYSDIPVETNCPVPTSAVHPQTFDDFIKDDKGLMEQAKQEKTNNKNIKRLKREIASRRKECAIERNEINSINARIKDKSNVDQKWEIDLNERKDKVKLKSKEITGFRGQLKEATLQSKKIAHRIQIRKREAFREYKDIEEKREKEEARRNNEIRDAKKAEAKKKRAKEFLIEEKKKAAERRKWEAFLTSNKNKN